jgi:GNAT superfamily N-acetyltransferase
VSDITRLSLHTRLRIRYGTPNDADACQRLTRTYRYAFPFVMKSSLIEMAMRGTLLIAEVDGIFAGFVSYYARRDGWNTVYEIAVDPTYAGEGVGRNLLYAVPTPIRLKCPTDNYDSNVFYARAGMELAGYELKARPLFIWELRVLAIHCQGNNRRVPTWARQAGMAYGCRHDDTPRDYVFFQDINWKRYDWQDYAHKVATWHPVMAMVADYERPDQRALMLQQVADLRALGVLRVMVCPKFTGAVADIPRDCIVAISLPSRYAGFVPDPAEHIGRRVHLLGGNPGDARKAVSHWGNVASADYNVHERNAQSGMLFDGAQWVRRSPLAMKTAEYGDAVPYSGANIRRALQAAATVRQAVLL